MTTLVIRRTIYFGLVIVGVTILIYSLCWGYLIPRLVSHDTIMGYIKEQRTPIWVYASTLPYRLSNKLMLFHYSQSETVDKDSGMLFYFYVSLGCGDYNFSK
jgi:hypothetical protein